MFIVNNSYLCSVNKIKEKMKNPLSETRKAQKDDNYEKECK